MNYLNAENFLKSAIKWLAFLILFTPLIISNSTLFPYVMGKGIAIQVIVEIMLICYIWLLYTNKKRTGRLEYLPPLNWLAWALLAFFAALVLSTFFGVDSYYSFWSKQERMDGLFNLFHYFSLAFILAGSLKDHQSWRQILNVSLIASFIVSLHALGQMFDIFFTPYGNRVTATLGNAAFLGTYLLFNIFFAFYLLLKTKIPWLKLIYTALIVFEIFILLFTYTRGAILGLLAGFILFLIGYAIFAPSNKTAAPDKKQYRQSFCLDYYVRFIGWINDKNRKKKIAVGLLVAVIAFWGIVFTFRDAAPVKNNSILHRLTDLSLESGTGKIRTISWGIGLKAFLDKPIFGWGQENYYVAFNQNINPVFFTYSGETFDRAHNRFVDLLVMNGIIGFLAYLAIYLSTVFLLFKNIKKRFSESLLLISLLGAYFVQNFVLFDMPVSYLMFFFSLGLVFFTTAEQPAPVATVAKPGKKHKINSKNGFRYFVWPATLIIIIFLWVGNFKPLFASKDSIAAQSITGLENSLKNDRLLEISKEKFEESIGYNTFTNSETRKVLPQIALSIINDQHFTDQAKYDFLLFAEKQLKQGIEEMPYFFDYHLSLTDLYHNLGPTDEKYTSEANKIIQEAVNLYPNVPYIRYKHTVNLVIAGKYQEAIESAQKTINLNPQLSQSQWFGAVAYFYANNLAQAKIHAEKAIENGFAYQNAPQNLNLLTQIYEGLGEYEMALKYYEEAYENNYRDPQMKYAMAKAYKQIGQIDKAKEFAQQAYQEMPEEQAKEVAEFLISLDNFSSARDK